MLDFKINKSLISEKDIIKNIELRNKARENKDYKEADKIRDELKSRVEFFESKKLFLEAQRIEQRTKFDLEMISATGSCSGIENYSRHLTGR